MKLVPQVLTQRGLQEAFQKYENGDGMYYLLAQQAQNNRSGNY